MSWEVRTMRSVTSCFNPALFKKNLSRFWPIWTLYGLIWIFALPINLMLSAGAAQAIPMQSLTLPTAPFSTSPEALQSQCRPSSVFWRPWRSALTSTVPDQ